MFSIHNESPSAVVNDPAWMVAIRSLYQKVVREWIIKSLSYAPCTSQGLLQVCKYTHSCSWMVAVWSFDIYPMELLFSIKIKKISF